MSNKAWQLQEAKNKLSELIDRASEDVPQLITRRGKPIAYVVSAKAWERRNRIPLKKILQACPAPEFFESIERDPSPGREIDL
ncbi:MAG: type II toxin-antitoxin system Phd/YefM family antitoxin [Spirochaetaceae bacterium]|nr:MAG: type II toxin-antitoxin system Phd/YefM family antitoxin [Spirochaetaceae bacterium]